MGLFVVVLLVAIGASSVTPSSQEALPRSFVKREAQGKYYAPDPYYTADPYYPLRKEDPPPPAEEEESSSSKVVDLYYQLFGKEKEECGIERLSPPIIIIAIFLGIIMAVTIGVLPALQIPPIIIPLNGLLLPNLLLPNLLNQILANPGVIPIIQIPKGRALSGDDEEHYFGNLISGSFDMLTNHVLDVIESEDCAKRLWCESGKYVEGRELLLRMMDFFVPEVYQDGLSVVKDSALEQMNCTSIACSYIDDDCFH